MTPYGARFKQQKRDPLQVLSRQIGLSKLAMMTESFLQAFWPLFSLLFVVYGFVTFGGLTVFPLFLVWGLLIVSGVLAVWLLVAGFRGFRVPDRAAVLARLDAGMANNPISALSDQQAPTSNDPVTKLLWATHLERMEAEAQKARATMPEPALAARDPFGIRLMAIVVMIVAVGFAPKPDFDTIIATVKGDEITVAGPSVAIEAWATPPAYTGKPALYLTELALNEQIDLPVGSEITVRFYGEGNFTLSEELSGKATVLPAITDDAPVQNITFRAVQDGQIVLKDSSAVLGRWDVTVIPDLPPTLRVPDGVEKTADGALKLTYGARDDYGIESATLVIRPDMSLINRQFGLTPDTDVPSPFERELPMPFSADRTDIKETFVEDFSTHIWAHLPVVITLEVTDASGQTASLVLEPEGLKARTFFDPLAAAIVEQRRDLMWSDDNDPRVSQVLRAMTYKPLEGLFPSSSAYLMTRTAIRRLGYQMENGLDDGERAELTAFLWEIAVKIEDGDLSSAEARLRRAQERVAQALENGATEEEMSELLDELRDATDEYLDQLARDAEPGEPQEQDPNARGMTMDQLQEMLDRLEELTQNGQTEEARQLLEELREFMENMEVTQSQPQQGQQGQEQQNLQDSLEQQQQLSDEAFQQLQEMLDQGEQGQGGEELAERQEALRQFLEDLQGQAGSEEAEQALEDAEGNMGEARDRLEEGDFSGALDEQAEVMENLRQGLREIQNRNQADQAGEDGQVDPENAQRDPLGRPVGSQGRVDNGDTAVPDQNDADRAKEIMEEIRRRSGDVERPQEELDYLRRLLERF